MAAIRQTFFQECEEQLADLEAGLLAMNEGSADSETVNAVFRAVHSIKGGAGAFKLEALVQFAHTFETTLDLVRGNKLSATSDVMKVMLRAADVLSDLVEASRDGTDIEDASWSSVADDVRALSTAATGGQEEEDFASFDFQPTIIAFGEPEAVEAGAVDSKRAYHIHFKPMPELFSKANEPALLLRELRRLGDIEVVCDALDVPALEDLDVSTSHLSWSIKLSTDQDKSAILEVFEFVDGDCELTVECDSEPAIDDGDVMALLRRVQADVDAAVAQPLELPSNASDAVPAFSAPVHVEPAMVEHIPQPSADAGKPESKSAANAPAATPAQATIRVEFERVDRLINLVGELVINQAMLSQRVIEADFAGSSSLVMGLDELEQLTREIQESVMAIRAQPVKPLFQRMSRIVREIADVTNKEVRLKTEGEGTEVDKTVVERLADPLTHLIRNAVDHGLEKPEVRIAAGKPAEGTVRLSAAHRSGRIVIEVADDGAGINRPKVRDIAVKKGLISADVQLTDSEIDNLLFLPGFSTATVVSNISGRGVGMDVVKRSIQALGGRISITSKPGFGSTFSMSLPLTLAVLDGMVVSVGGQTLVVPLTAIVETLQPKKADVHPLGADGRVIAIRNTFVPLIDVGTALGFSSTLTEPTRGVAILVETEGGARNALMVDAIQDQRQVVIKSLEANYGAVEGIAAATILGDGRVALILDVDALVQRSRDDISAVEFRTGTEG